MIRVQTPNGVGAIPFVKPADASHNYLRIQTQNHGILAVHDSVGGVIPDSGVARYNFENDVSDSWNNNSATNNGGSFTTDSKVDSYAISLNGDDVRVPLGQSLFDSGEFSIATWVKKNDTNTGNTNEGVLSYDNRTLGISYNDINNTGGFEMIINDESVSIGSESVGLQSYIHLGITYDGSTATFYYGGNPQGSISGSISGGASETILGYSPNVYSGYANVTLDDTKFYNKEISSTEMTNLRNTGSISG